MTEIIALLLSAFANILKDVIEDAISGKLMIPPATVTPAESDPVVEQQAQNVLDAFDGMNP